MRICERALQTDFKAVSRHRRTRSCSTFADESKRERPVAAVAPTIAPPTTANANDYQSSLGVKILRCYKRSDWLEVWRGGVSLRL